MALCYLYFLGYSLHISSQSINFVLNIGNYTKIYLGNLTGNATYELRIKAATSAGYGPITSPYRFFVNENFTGIF